MLTKIEANIKKYQADHRGEKPLYILVSPYEADSLYDEVRQAGGYSIDTIVTTYQGSKIVKYEALKRGDLQLTDELPEASGWVNNAFFTALFLISSSCAVPLP